MGAGNYSAVDEEGRRAAYANPVPFRNIFFDRGLIFSAIHACFEAVSIEPDFLCQLLKDLWTTFRRSVEKFVMVSPEFTRFVGATRRLVGFACSRVKALDRKITKDQLYFFAVFGFEPGPE